MKKVSREERVTLAGRVKWFDPVRGFGFIVQETGAPDILIHIECIRAFGITSLPNDTEVVVLVERTEERLRAVELLSVSHLPDGPPALPPASDTASGPFQPACVKWFDRNRGFGFVNVFGVSGDMFVHNETVRRSGFHTLTAGEAVLVRTTEGPRGPVVCEMRPWVTE